MNTLAPPTLRRQWTSNKIKGLVHKRAVDIGKNILRNVVFTCNPKTIEEVLREADEKSLLHGYTHPTGRRPHRSTVAIHNGRIMERRVYFNSWQIEWLPI
jgi:hypothetical protein